jgi:hypothetical protein
MENSRHCRVGQGAAFNRKNGRADEARPLFPFSAIGDEGVAHRAAVPVNRKFIRPLNIGG